MKSAQEIALYQLAQMGGYGFGPSPEDIQGLKENQEQLLGPEEGAPSEQEKEIIREKMRARMMGFQDVEEMNTFKKMYPKDYENMINPPPITIETDTDEFVKSLDDTLGRDSVPSDHDVKRQQEDGSWISNKDYWNKKAIEDQLRSLYNKQLGEELKSKDRYPINQVRGELDNDGSEGWNLWQESDPAMIESIYKNMESTAPIKIKRNKRRK